MVVYVIAECRLDGGAYLKSLPYVRMVTRSREKAKGWFEATRDSCAMLGTLLDEGSGYNGSMDGAWFSFKTNYGGVYEETIVTFNEEETR